MRRAGIGQNRRHLAGGDERSRGDCVRRIDPAEQHVDLVLGEQLLDDDLGAGAAGVLLVALDELEGVGLQLFGVELQVLRDTTAGHRSRQKAMRQRRIVRLADTDVVSARAVRF